MLWWLWGCRLSRNPRRPQRSRSRPSSSLFPLLHGWSLHQRWHSMTVTISGKNKNPQQWSMWCFNKNSERRGCHMTAWLQRVLKPPCAELLWALPDMDNLIITLESTKEMIMLCHFFQVILCYAAKSKNLVSHPVIRNLAVWSQAPQSLYFAMQTKHWKSKTSQMCHEYVCNRKMAAWMQLLVQTALNCL